MATVALTIVGGLLGPIGAGLGAALGGYLDEAFILPALFGEDNEDIRVEHGRLNSLQLQHDSEGAPIAFVRGTEMRLAGTVIWMTDLLETATASQQSSGGGGGGKGGKTGPTTTSVNYTYRISCAIAICEGPITRIEKIWANDKVIFDVNILTPKDGRISGDLNIHLGTETQIADPVIEGFETDVPPFRDLAYVVIEDLQLADFGNRLPTFSFLIQADPADVTVLAYWPFDDSIGAIASGSVTRPAESIGLVNDGNKLAAANVAIFTPGAFGNFLGGLGAGGLEIPRDTTLNLNPKDDVALCDVLAFDFRWRAPLPEGGTVGLKMTVKTQAGAVLMEWETGIADAGTPNFPDQKATLFTSSGSIVTPTPFPAVLNTLPSAASFFHTRVVIHRTNPIKLQLIVISRFLTEVTEVIGVTADIFDENDIVIQIEDTGDSDAAQFDELAVLTGCPQLRENNPLIAGGSFLYRDDQWLQGDWTINSGFGYKLASMCRAILERSSLLLSSQIDVTKVEECARGFIAQRPMSVSRQLEPVLGAYDVAVRESNGQLVLFAKNSRCGNADPIQAIARKDLAAHERGSPTRDRLQVITDRADFTVPKEVNVEYMEPALDYQNSSQRERATFVTTDVIKNLRFPLVFTTAEGRQIAERFLWRAWAERKLIEFTVPPSLMELEETDLLSVDSDLDTFKVRITQLNRGASGLIEIKGVIEEIATLRGSIPSEFAGSLIARGLVAPPDMRLHILDLPPLRDIDASRPGYYHSAAVDDPLEDFIGASIVVSEDDVAFVQVATVGIEGPMGDADTVLADGPTTIIDVGNTVDVTLIEGALVSITDLELLDGGNRALLGNEIIGFGIATLLGGSQYRLSRLLRGVRNTEIEAPLHGASERFVLLEVGPVGFVEMNTAGLNKTRFWRAPSTYQAVVDAAPSVTLAIAGRSVTPFGPAQIAGLYNAGGDLTVTWERRSRGIGQVFGPASPAVFEVEEKYEFDALDAPGGSVVRTFSIKVTTGTRSFVYTAAQIAADGFAALASIDFLGFQIGAIVGRGNQSVGVAP